MHFVDYGNTEVISLRSIVFLSHEILSLVPFAQLYCLHGVTATNGDLYDKVLYILETLPPNLLRVADMKIMSCNFSSMFTTDYNDRGCINFKNLVQDECMPSW